MAAVMAELTRQNQELRMEINLRRQAREEREGGGQTQSHDDRENIEIGSKLRGTTSRTVPHLKEEMDQMKKVIVTTQGKALATSALYLKRTSHY